MLRRITRNKQVTIPKEFMERLHLDEGDYVNMECEGDSIRVRPVVIQDFSPDDYKELAARLDRLKEKPGKTFENSDSAREHLRDLMG